MLRYLVLPLLFVAIVFTCARAQAPETAKREPLPLGLRLKAVPDLLYDQLPQLKRGVGVVVEEVQPGSAAAQAGLRRHDILLSYSGESLRGAEHFQQLVRAGVQDHAVALVLLRGGQTTPLDVMLAQAAPLFLNTARAALKPVGPPTVDVEAQRLEGGKLQITFTYYQPTGKLERVRFSGSITEIENEVRALRKQDRMPPRVENLVEVALRRIRLLDVPAKN